MHPLASPALSAPPKDPAGLRRIPPRALPAALAVLAATLAAALPCAAGAAPTPKGGCPQPAHTLALQELQVGIGAKPRWIEIANPGDEPVSLANVVVRVQAKGLGGAPADGFGVLEFPVGDAVAELPAGEVLLVGHLPVEPGNKAPPGPWFGLKLVDVGAAFVLPLCDVKVQVLGPAGPIDTFVYTLCKEGLAPPGDAAWQTVLSLDPAHLDICANDVAAVWCQPTLPNSSAKATPGKPNDPCDLDSDGYTAATGDCDDQLAAVSPIAVELCNGKDDDCDGQTDEGVVAAVGTCLGAGVCAGPLPDGSPIAFCDGKNGYVCNYPVGYETVQETLCDGYDNDCDGQTDEGLTNGCGACGPLPAELCDGADNDCDGQTDEVPDLSMVACAGVGVCAAAIAICSEAGPICSMPLAFEATETRCDGADNDCDGQTDEELGRGQPCVAGAGRCAAQGIVACAPDGDVDCVAATGTPEPEVCGNNQDDDCDGQTDEGFGVGTQCLAGLGVCQVIGKQVCAIADGGGPSTATTCLAKAPIAAGVERCDNALDDDCDGFTDEPGCERPSADGGCSAAPVGVAAAGGLTPALAPLALAAAALLGLLALRAAARRHQRRRLGAR